MGATYLAAPCPKCNARVYDNRDTKRNPKAPDGKCSNRSCDFVVWPPRGQQSNQSNGARVASAPAAASNGGNARQPYNIGVTGIAELDAGMVEDEQRFVNQVRGADQVADNAAQQRLNRIFRLQEACFAHALTLAKDAKERGIPMNLEGVSALTAQALIAFKDGR